MVRLDTGYIGRSKHFHYGDLVPAPFCVYLFSDLPLILMESHNADLLNCTNGKSGENFGDQRLSVKSIVPNNLVYRI